MTFMGTQLQHVYNGPLYFRIAPCLYIIAASAFGIYKNFDLIPFFVVSIVLAVGCIIFHAAHKQPLVAVSLFTLSLIAHGCAVLMALKERWILWGAATLALSLPSAAACLLWFVFGVVGGFVDVSMCGGIIGFMFCGLVQIERERWIRKEENEAVMDLSLPATEFDEIPTMPASGYKQTEELNSPKPDPPPKIAIPVVGSSSSGMLCSKDSSDNSDSDRKRSSVPSILNLSDKEPPSPRTGSVISVESMASTSSRQSVVVRDIFIATVSDELRTPVSALYGLLDIMKVDDRERESVSNWNTLTNIADTLLLLVDNLIDVAKLAVDPHSLLCQPSPCDLEEIIRKVVESFNVQMLSRSVYIIPTFDLHLCGTGAVLADKSRIYQFLANILQEVIRSDITDTTLFFEVKPDPAAEMKIRFLLSVEALQELPPLENIRRVIHGRPCPRMNVTVGIAGIRACGGDVAIVGNESIQITTNCVIVNEELDKFEKMSAYIVSSALPESTQTIICYLHQLHVKLRTVSDFSEIDEMSTKNLTVIVFTGPNKMPPPFSDTARSIVVMENSKEETPPVATHGHHDDTIYELRWPFYPADFYRALRGKTSSNGTTNKLNLSNNFMNLSNRSVVLGAQHPVHLLVVEDNNVINRVTTRKLSLVFRQVTSVANGEDAITEYCNAPPRTFDVILMDVEMPGISGIEATKRIRSYENQRGWEPVIIVAFTANAAASDVDVCKECGMDDYMCKPLNVEKLVSILESKDVLKKKPKS